MSKVQADHDKYEQCKSEAEVCWNAAKAQNVTERKNKSGNTMKQRKADMKRSDSKSRFFGLCCGSSTQ